MRKYKVRKTNAFYQSVEAIHSYIFDKSRNIQVANHFTENLLNYPDLTFEYAPLRGTLFIRNGKPYRKIPYSRNSEYFYIVEVDEMTRTVVVINLLHAKRNCSWYEY